MDPGTAGPGALLMVEGLSGIVAGFSTRLGGSSLQPFETLNVRTDVEDAAALGNQQRILDAMGLGDRTWVKSQQVHGADVVTVEGPCEPGGADALLTSAEDVAVAVHVADCMPILLADPAGGRVSVVHAGWRGLVAGVIQNAVAALNGGVEVHAVVGPSIGPCCFQVGPEVAEAAVQALGEGVVRGDRVDLWTGALVALRRAGVTRVHLSTLCTRCEPHRFYSHRAGDQGRQALVAAIVR